MVWYNTIVFQARDSVPFQYLIRRLIVRYNEVSKARDPCLEFSDRSETGQVCRDSRQTSKRSNNFKYKSRGFKTLRDFTIKYRSYLLFLQLYTRWYLQTPCSPASLMSHQSNTINLLNCCSLQLVVHHSHLQRWLIALEDATVIENCWLSNWYQM